MKLIYVAGRFRGKTSWEVEQNVIEAQRVGATLAGTISWQLMPVIPHTMSKAYAGIRDDEYWLEGTMELLRRCDAVYLCDNWEKSEGAMAEKLEAERLGIPVFDRSSRSSEFQAMISGESPQKFSADPTKWDSATLTPKPIGVIPQTGEAYARKQTSFHEVITAIKAREMAAEFLEIRDILGKPNDVVKAVLKVAEENRDLRQTIDRMKEHLMSAIHGRAIP